MITETETKTETTIPENLDFPEIIDNVPDLPEDLIPTELMTQLFIHNCKEQNCWT